MFVIKSIGIAFYVDYVYEKNKRKKLFYTKKNVVQVDIIMLFYNF